MFFWIGIVAGVGLLLLTAKIVLPPIIEGYEFRDLDILAEAWILATTTFVLCYFLIGLFERGATAGIREDVRANTKEVRIGTVESIDERTEPEPTEVRLLESDNGHYSFSLKTIRELNLLTASVRSHAKAGGAVRVEIAPHSRVVLTIAAVSD
jgi:hypothetical protein